MVVRIKWSALKQTRWYEYVLRFVLNGLVLAFPAIFCASATLIEKHERKRKEKLGLLGRRRGKEAAALDAAGAGLGSIGLTAFGAGV